MSLSIESETLSVSQTVSGNLKTSEATIHLSKRYRPKTSKKLRALIKFTPRTSHFDTTNELSGANEFRGFFTLFWMSMFLFALKTYVRSLETNGYALDFAFATLFSQDAVGLAMSDAAVLASTAICVPFAKAVNKGWIRYHWTGVILQHIWQTSILILAITWTFNRNWPWVQSGFLTLHTLVMLMKVHSYISTNGELHQVSVQAQTIRDRLQHLTDNLGGWDKALIVAKARLNEQTGITPSGESTDPAGSTPEIILDVSSSTVMDIHTATALRKRLVAVVNNESPLAPSEGRLMKTELPSSVPDHVQSTGVHLLVNHPNEEISTLAKELLELEIELTSTGPNAVRWPDNITYKNFADFQLIPTLVYELEYPRTDRIRPIYVFEKTVATFGTFALLYTITERFILPLTPTPDQSFFRSLLDLALPFMMCYLLLFYLIFECICNGFAELSYFADRQFYEDWYACGMLRPGMVWYTGVFILAMSDVVSPDFARKWNKPVHTFLLRHVYASTITHYQLSRTTAMFLTFLLSAAVHELVMVIVTRKIRMYLFMMQLVQVPLIAISRVPFIKRNHLLGNVVFWVGIYAGLPLLCVAYVAY